MAKPSIITPVALSKHIFFGLYGDGGIGKTRLIASSPGQVLIIRPPTDHLNSMLPADKARAAKGEIEQAIVRDWDDMDELLLHLRMEGERYDWVWVDTKSALFHTLLDDVWDDAVQRKKERKEFDLDKGEFGINMNRLSRWTRHIVGIDKFNFGYTAWGDVTTSPDKDEDGDPIEKLMPWIQGKNMASLHAGYMNIVGYYHKAKIGGKDDVRVLRTESTPRYYAKDQFDATGGRVVNPTMPKIIDLIDKSPGRAKAAPASRTKTTTTKKRPIRVARTGGK